MRPLLQVVSLSKAFRGVRAVRDASFEVEEGSITGLIGPNGSGKSTMIDCISGFQRPDAGRVSLAGADITHLPPATVTQAGLIRTFQSVRVYDTYTLVDNLMVADARLRGTRWHHALLRSRSFRDTLSAAEDRARALIELVGLTKLVDAPATVLSYGQKKLLAFAAAMMSQPKLIVLDEPVAGVNPTRINDVAGILRAANAGGVSFLIVEHNVEFINSLCDKVIVFEQGHKLTEGTPEDVRHDPRVLDAYLGVASDRSMLAAAVPTP